MKKRFFSLILAIIMLGAFLAGCGADPTPSDPAPANDAPASSAASADTPSSGDVTQLRFLLDVSEDSEQGKEFAVLLQQFHDENPDIKVNLEIATTDDMKTKIRTEAAADQMPDLFYYWASKFNSMWLWESDLLVEFDTLVDSMSNLDRSNFNEDDLATMVVNDKVYGIPFDGGYMGMVYNKKLYDQCGLKLPTEYETYTHDQFREDGKVFIENGIIPLAVTAQGGNPIHNHFSNIYMQLPGGAAETKGLTEGKNPVTDSGNFAKAIGYLQEDIRDGMFPEDLFSGNWPAQQALFVEEKAAAIFTLGMFMSQMPPELAEHCVIGPFPQFPEAEYTPKQFAHGSLTYSMNVPKKSWNESPEKRDAIIRFLEFFFSGDNLSLLAKYNEVIVNRDDIVRDRAPLCQELIDFVQGKDKPVMFSNAIYDSTLFNEFKFLLEEACALTLTPEEFEEQNRELFAQYLD